MGTSATALIVTCLLLVPWTCASGSTVAEYTIDLDLPPNKRYDSFVKNYNKTVWQFYEDYFAKDKLLTDALYLIVDERGSEPPEMQGEIEGLATASKLPLKFVQGIQMLYELQTLMVPIENVSSATHGAKLPSDLPVSLRGLSNLPHIGCTGIIAQDSSDNGTVYHARNLDFSLPGVPSSKELFKKLVFVGVFKKGGKELFRSQMIAGYTQIITAMRRDTTDGYTIERNTRFPSHAGGNEEMFKNLKSGRPLNGWVLRKVLESEASYDAAVTAITAAKFVSTEFSIISGVRKGTILARDPEEVAHTQTLGQPNFEEPPSYIIMTNFDFYWHDIREWFDNTAGKIGHPRRIIAQSLLNATGPLTPQRLFATISAPGVFADTVFQAIINVEKDVWNVSVPVGAD